MVYNQRTAHLINNIQGVIKFLGTGAEPQPLRDDELAKIFGGPGGGGGGRGGRAGRADPLHRRAGRRGGRGSVQRVQRHGAGDLPDKGKVKVEVSPLRAPDQHRAGLHAAPEQGDIGRIRDERNRSR
jgi:transcription antitermination factor NusG